MADDLQITGWSPDELTELAGLGPDELRQRFTVVPADALARGRAAAVAMGGAFCLVGETLHFRPRHPFAAGTAYAFLERADERADQRADQRADHEDAPVLITRPSARRTPSTVVTEIYPTSAELPRNALRFYVHFSAPMSEGLAAPAVQLRDAESGEPLDGAILPMTPELWDPARTRLTLLLDPGRIKRGLVPHTEAGYPLHAGHSVTLHVSPRFLDATGTPLAAEATRRYTVGAGIRRRLDPSAWAIEPPEPGTSRPMQVRFDRPVDHALGLRCLTVVATGGRAVSGTPELAPGEREWTFTPSAPWAAAPYTLLVASELEDVAGNSISRVFDRDLGDPADDPDPARTVAIDLGAQ